MRIHERCERRAERQRCERGELRRLQDDARRAALRLEVLVCRIEHMTIAAQLQRNQPHRRDHDDIDHDVLDERDHRRRAQAARIRIEREDHERDDERRLARHAEPLDHDLHADQLQRDVRHRRDDARQRDGSGKPFAAVLAVHVVGSRDVVLRMRDLPQFRHDRKHERIDDDRIRKREEAIRADGIDQRGHGNHRIGRIEIAADEEPRNDRAELASAETPLVQLREITCFPSRGNEAEYRDEKKECDEYGHRDRVHGVEFAHLIPR